MIARFREPLQDSPASRNAPLERARRILAAAILVEPIADSPPEVSAWRAWLMVTWMIAVSAVYAASMVGWLR